MIPSKRALKRYFVFPLSLFFLFISSNCETVDNAIDDTFNELVFKDWEGLYENSEGWEVTLNSDGTAVYTKQGSPMGGSGNIGVGTYLAQEMVRISDNSWSGLIREEGGRGIYGVNGTASIINDVLTFKPVGESSFSFVRTEGETGSVTETLVNQLIEGEDGDVLYISLTIPQGVASMTVTTTEDSEAYRNTADLFVRHGAMPTITPSPYSWVADCAGIKPNRENENCFFNDPSPGVWYFVLYGYNTYFSSRLKVTITY